MKKMSRYALQSRVRRKVAIPIVIASYEKMISAKGSIQISSNPWPLKIWDRRAGTPEDSGLITVIQRSQSGIPSVE